MTFNCKLEPKRRLLRSRFKSPKKSFLNLRNGIIATNVTAVLVRTNGAVQMKVATTRRRNKIRLSAAAQRTNLTSQGLLKILRRTGSAIRDDGRWYVDPAIIDQITKARCVLGFGRTKQTTRKLRLRVGHPTSIRTRQRAR
jgi:hypothetical protein